ncbi:hypothetical protein CP97_11260 [Aurantiacibacter atlanticus]|uniref:BioF2-like acetyltransferase domain-containing protein n=1 Tax=Aurantiacibacter atlanticus TaxID=1648404 RepID=A0A0H4VFA5_9SPHN|nr:GNAT family N-acetyltransferase [Aurantiacibacter atlanticus]AKQ43402.2 hypothetical protein CP97_11260 [Aurantiacibacter atlanticus]
MGKHFHLETRGFPLAGDGCVHGALRGTQAVFSACDWRDMSSVDRISEWDALAQIVAEPNPFFESWFMLPALDALDPQGSVTILKLEVDGRLFGLMPVKRENRYYGYPVPHLRNWVHDNCFLGTPLVARGFERMFWQHLFSWADRRPRMAAFLHLTQMPTTGPVHDALQTYLTPKDNARPAATVMLETRAMLSSTDTSEQYFDQALSTKKRKELRRQQRRLAEMGTLEVEKLDNADAIADWSQNFLALERRGWKGKSGSALACDIATQSLFCGALEGAAQRGRLQRFAMTLDGQPIAMLANFLTAPGAFSFKTAFDEDFARFSPGVLLQRENLAMLDRDDIIWTDSCAAQDHPMIDHFWRERRTIARHSIGIGGPVRRAIFAALARHETRGRGKPLNMTVSA